MDQTTERFQILALDGGGVKALFTAHVLARIEDDLGVTVADSFDLIAGTSAGGILALALGAGLRPAEIVEHYERLAATVFPRLDVASGDCRHASQVRATKRLRCGRH